MPEMAAIQSSQTSEKEKWDTWVKDHSVSRSERRSHTQRVVTTFVNKFFVGQPKRGHLQDPVLGGVAGREAGAWRDT
jgi:hypothetical protein